jgi:hypothetical protein
VLTVDIHTVKVEDLKFKINFSMKALRNDYLTALVIQPQIPNLQNAALCDDGAGEWRSPKIKHVFGSPVSDRIPSFAGHVL